MPCLNGTSLLVVTAFLLINSMNYHRPLWSAQDVLKNLLGSWTYHLHFLQSSVLILSGLETPTGWELLHLKTSLRRYCSPGIQSYHQSLACIVASYLFSYINKELLCLINRYRYCFSWLRQAFEQRCPHLKREFWRSLLLSPCFPASRSHTNFHRACLQAASWVCPWLIILTFYFFDASCTTPYWLHVSGVSFWELLWILTRSCCPFILLQSLLSLEVFQSEAASCVLFLPRPSQSASAGCLQSCQLRTYTLWVL